MVTLAADLASRGIKPWQAFEWYAQQPLEVPSIVEFIFSDRYLGRPNLYPRQLTLLKVITLQTELFTSYDEDVIAEWATEFEHTGNHGIVPDIEQRLKIAKDEENRPWFRENVIAIGRRGSKGFSGGLLGAYVLWHYMAKGDPHAFYGVDPDKQFANFVFAGKREQAKVNQWRDIVNVVLAAPCFTPYISRSLDATLTVFAPSDFRKMLDRERRGVDTSMDPATFLLQPKESTPMAARGPASYAIHFDEMAHVVAAGANRSAAEVYESATPSLDQFKQDAFIYEGSSTWQKIGQFYENYENSLKREDGRPVYPEMFMAQLTSWDPYVDWERAHELSVEPGGPKFQRKQGAIQEYDYAMERLERANPESFAVERRCLDPDTLVLTADLQWVRIDDLVVGDEVVAFDEEPPAPGRQRRMRTAVVEGVQDSHDVAYRITFTDGTSVVCSGNHRWMSSTPGDPGHYRWRTLFAEPDAPGPRVIMKPGDRIKWLVDPWTPDVSWEAGYIAGVYDGEGTVVTREGSEFAVAFVQNPNEVLYGTERILKDKGYELTWRKTGGRKAKVFWVRGFAQAARFIGEFGGYKMRRQALPHLWEGRGIPRGRGHLATYKEIALVEEVGEQRLVDIQTSTGTFIAEGLLSHNSHFQTVLDAYLREDKVLEAFEPWNGQTLTMQRQGILSRTYKAHGDPAKSGDRFGFAIGHAEPDPDDPEIKHVVFDVIHAWDPAEYPDHTIDYEDVYGDIWQYVVDFQPFELTFDQWSSAAYISRLQRDIRKATFTKRVDVYEHTATLKSNWQKAEVFKTALNMGWVHFPAGTTASEILELELKFLRQVPTSGLHGKVDHPDVGPVTTKDVADAVFDVVYTLLADQVVHIRESLGDVRTKPMQQGGLPVAPAPREEESVFSALSSASRGGMASRMSPSRGRRR